MALSCQSRCYTLRCTDLQLKLRKLLPVAPREQKLDLVLFPSARTKSQSRSRVSAVSRRAKGGRLSHKGYSPRVTTTLQASGQCVKHPEIDKAGAGHVAPQCFELGASVRAQILSLRSYVPSSPGRHQRQCWQSWRPQLSQSHLLNELRWSDLRATGQDFWIAKASLRPLRTGRLLLARRMQDVLWEDL
jgi:hypothetical protein